MILPGALDHGGFGFANAFNFQQALGSFFDDFQGIRPEQLYQSCGHGRSDTFNNAGSQVIFDTIDCRRQRHGKRLNFKLLPIFAMGHPGALNFNGLTGTHTCQITHHRQSCCRIGPFKTRNRVMGILVKIGNPLKMPLEGKQWGGVFFIGSHYCS